MLTLIALIEILPKGWGVLIEPNARIENAFDITLFSTHVPYLGKAFNVVTVSKELLQEPDISLLTVAIKEVIMKMQDKIRQQDEG